MLGTDIRFKKVDLKEFESLCTMLVREGIPFSVKERFGGRSLAIPSHKELSNAPGSRTISVICFEGSYGSNDGLLEIYAAGLNKGVEGYLTAQEAFEYIKDTLNGISRHSDG